MKSMSKISRWQEGRVDRTKMHFELRYGSANDNWNLWIQAALVGPPIAGIVKVQFLVDPGNVSVLTDVVKEIQFYLIDKKEEDPWWYAQYHCGTAANLYSHVHWSFFKPKTQFHRKGGKKSKGRKKAALTRK